MILESVPAAEIKWPRDTGTIQQLRWSRGGDPLDTWVVVSVLSSVGGAAGFFAGPPQMDPMNSST